MNEKIMINALVCDLISKVTFDCDLFWHNQISSAEFTKRSKEYSKEFTESFASLIRCANEQDEGKMMTDKEKEQFMPREEAKMRKWASRQRALKELIDASDAYYRTEKDVEKSTYYLRVKNLLCLLKERADAHFEKWQNKQQF